MTHIERRSTYQTPQNFNPAKVPDNTSTHGSSSVDEFAKVSKAARGYVRSTPPSPISPHKVSETKPRSVTLEPEAYFDPPGAQGYQNAVRIVGSYTPRGNHSWGKIHLLEGQQMFLEEQYNNRTERLGRDTTYHSSKYPLKRFFGHFNQEVVDAFNLHYGQEEVKASPDAKKANAQRPQARFALLHEGPKTTKGEVDPTKRPVLLIHGAMQDANVWLWPAGFDGRGSYGSPKKPVQGMVQSLEEEGRATYAITFGNSHGSNLSQAIHVANAIRHLKETTGHDKVDIVAWSKGGVPVDLLLANVSQWDDWGSDHFSQVKALQATAVPEYQGDIGHYVSMGSPHGGLDLNWRHPFKNQFIMSADPRAPAGRGPVTWSKAAAVQCVNFGPSLGLKNDFAQGISEDRGGTWNDYWNQIHMSNIEGLDDQGRPVYRQSLRKLNVKNGASARKYDLDAYNLAMWGSVNAEGRPVIPYMGQLELVHDFRDQYPIDDLKGPDAQDPDQTKWYTWLQMKAAFNPFAFVPAGGVKQSLKECRNAAYESDGSCDMTHVSTEAGLVNPMSIANRHSLFESVGIDTAARMGGRLIDRLREHGTSPDVDSLVVLYGKADAQSLFGNETDGPSDGVVFEDSAAAKDRLTHGWTPKQVETKARQEQMPADHLAMGSDPRVFQRVFAALEGQS